MNTFTEIIEKIKKIKNVKTDQDVAKIFDWTRQAIFHYKNDNRIPFKVLTEFCERENVSLDWLLLGREPNILESNEPDELAEIKKRLAALEKKN